jgi:4-hydroxybenzoyl-CoA thioesterase
MMQANASLEVTTGQSPPRVEAVGFDRVRTVHWGDADPAGVVFAPRFFEFAIDHVEDLYLELFGVGFHAFQRAESVEMPWVEMRCHFTAPVHPGEVLRLSLEVARVGTTSVTYEVRGSGPDRVTRFCVTLTSVAIAPWTGRPTALPALLRERLEGRARLTLREGTRER